MSNRYRAANSWNDLPPVPITAAHPGVNAPTLTTFKSDIEQFTFNATNNLIVGASEVEHTYEAGTDIEIHVHWTTNGSEGSDKYVKFQVKYSVCVVGAAAGAQQTASAEIKIPAGTADRTHFVSTLGMISGTGIALGTYIVFRFERVAAVGAAPAADPFVLAVGFHARMDGSGSLTEYVK